MEINSFFPFMYGNPVSPAGFINRPRELRRLVGRITTGQSIALVGDPRLGKTSLLEYLRAQESQVVLYGPQAHQLIFFYMDGQTLPANFTQAQFWGQALQPLYDNVIAPHGEETPIALAYKTCAENEFGNIVLERFFTQVGSTQNQLVLLLDEFDVLLHHPVLNSAEFFGGLRSLASRSRGALCMVTASRQPLSVLNKKTQEFNPTGSPYFNFLDELVLGPFPKKASNELLAKAGDRFNAPDLAFTQRVAGGHPYLLQVVASTLWDAYEDEENPFVRRELAGEEMFDKAAATISETWRLWPPATKKAFTAVAIDHSALLLGGREYDVDELQKSLTSLGPELRDLKKQGYLEEDPEAPTRHRVRTEAFLWWLSEELIRTVRDDTSFEDWFREQEWEGYVKRGEKQQLGKAARWLGESLKEGVSTFIKAAAEGVAKGMTGKP